MHTVFCKYFNILDPWKYFAAETVGEYGVSQTPCSKNWYATMQGSVIFPCWTIKSWLQSTDSLFEVDENIKIEKITAKN